MNTLEKTIACAQLIIVNTMIETESEETSFEIKGFNNKETGENYGDFEISIKRINQ